MIYVFIFLLIVFQVLWLLTRYYKTPGNAFISAFEDDVKQVFAHLGVVVAALTAAISSAWDHIGPLLAQSDVTTVIRDWLAANVSPGTGAFFASFAVLAAAVWKATH